MAPWGCGRIDTPDLRGGDLRVTGAGRAPRLLRRSRGTVRRVSAARTDGDGSPKTSGDDVNRRPHADGPAGAPPAAQRGRRPHFACDTHRRPAHLRLHCRSPGTLRPAHRVHRTASGRRQGLHGHGRGRHHRCRTREGRAQPWARPLRSPTPTPGGPAAAPAACRHRPPPLLPRSVPWARPPAPRPGWDALRASLSCGVAAPLSLRRSSGCCGFDIGFLLASPAPRSAPAVHGCLVRTRRNTRPGGRSVP